MQEQVAFDALRSFTALAREIAGQPDTAAASSRVVELAVKTIGCQAAGIAQLRGRKLVFVAGTDPELFTAVAAIAKETDESISVQACRLRTPVICHDLEQEQRWPRASPLGVQRTPIRSVFAVPLQLDQQDLGVLTCYSMTAGFFTERRTALVGVYADHAAIALSWARAHEQVHHLQAAMDSSREIGVAVGIIMGQLKVDSATAFDLLRVASQNGNRRLHDLATEVAATGVVPSINRTARPTRARLNRPPVP